jgi:hypothetical protein
MVTFDEYKLVVETTERIPNRRAMISQNFFAVDTALLGAIAYVITKVDVQTWEQPVITLTLLAFGLLLSVIWSRIVREYRRLIIWRYDQIMRLEEIMSQNYKLFQKEWNHFFAPQADSHQSRYFFGNTQFEIVLSWFFFIFHSLLIIILILRTKWA